MSHVIRFTAKVMGGSRKVGWGGGGQVAVGVLRNSGTDPTRQAIGPLGPIAFRGRPVRLYGNTLMA